MILGTAGHIDHGKTALVRALTGVDTDRLPEEKRRGITIDLGFAPLAIEGLGTIGVVDVPGHEAFIRTMLAGASGIDVALIVIAADEGIMPQTREHLEILSLLGIRKGIVALTKCDLVESEWLDLVRDEVSVLLSSSSVDVAQIVPVSARTGDGITSLRDAIARAFAGLSARSDNHDLFRLPVDRAFSVKGTGTVVTGTVWSGSVARDELIIVQPGGRRSRVRAIQSHDTAVERASAGMRAAIALADCEVADVLRGSVLVADPHWMPTREFEAVLSFGDGFAPTPRTRVRIHIGTSETGGRFGGLGRDGETITARVILDHPIVARGGDRFVIRMPSPARTVGGGRVIDPYPATGKQKRLRASGAAVFGVSVERAVARLIEASGSQGASVQMIPVRTGMNPLDVGPALAKLGAIISGDIAVSVGALGEVANSIEKFIAESMANHPLEPGVSLQTVRATVRSPSEVIDLALARLQDERRIEVIGSVASPFGWVTRLGKKEQALSDAILHEICIQPAEPPSVAELTARYGPKTEAMLRKLERDGELERVSDDRYYGSGAVERMVGTLRSALDPAKIHTPAELREVLGVSRKYLIPFLEFCDRKGVTERRQNGRVVRRVDI